MEEKKKVFIRGNKYRGDEIRDILTGLGASTEYVSCDNDDYIYFITHENEISIAVIGSEVARIIMDNYKEIELPQQPWKEWKEWKDGDILIDNGYPKDYAVFRKYNNDDTFEAYFILEGKMAHFDATAYVEDYHLANTKEIEGLPLLFTFLMGALNEVGLCLPKKVEQK